MVNRRRFLGTTAIAAASACLENSVARAAAKYDLVVKGGRVIDPSHKLDAIRDVAMANGRIAAIGTNLPPGGAETIDARGKLVVPGLIDIHTHARAPKKGPRSVSPMGSQA